MSARRRLRLGDLDLSQQIASEAEYRRRLERAQLSLLLLQRAMHKHGHRAVIVFEGQDAAGKGGTIKRLTERLDPRGFVVHPTGAPSETERAEHWLQRFWRALPRAGTLAIFDRSWYGRVLVERVEKLAGKRAWQRAYAEIEAFEKTLADDGVPVLKFFLHISKKEQKRRFEERAGDPFSVWKLTKDDWRNRSKWHEYVEAIDEMLQRTDGAHARWHLVPAEFKWLARVRVLETCGKALGKAFGCDTRLPKGWRERHA